VPEQSRGKMVSMKTQSDRTLFFDLLPLDLGEIMGFKTRFLLYTVPGQVFYNATRKLVLKGADAIVFVADSEVGKMEENKESLANLRANLAEYGLKLDEIPWVIQYNKRDLPQVYPVDELNAELNPGNAVPSFEAVATQGKGVFETFRGISHLLMDKVTRELRRAPLSGRASKTEEPAGETISPIFGGKSPREAATPPPVEAAPVVAREPEIRPPAVTAPTPPAAPVRRTLPGTESMTPRNAPAVAPVASDGSGVTFDARPPLFSAAADSASSEGTRPGLAPRDMDLVGLERSAPSPVATSPAPASPAPAVNHPREKNEVVIPVTLPPGSSREIVLRIVLTQGD
jgi:signal recognition particle receptor subunit beta